MKKHQKQILALAVILVFTATMLLLTGLSEAGKTEKSDPVMTMLEDIYDVVVDTNLKVEGFMIQKTGQSLCWSSDDGSVINCEGTGQDGEYQNGVALPTPRFIDNGDGTVTDNLTKLMWTKDAQEILGEMNWQDAIDACNELSFATYDDWRLPNVREMLSLIDYGYYDPALTPGHPFINVPPYPGRYWVSTTMANNPLEAMHVPIVNGAVNGMNKLSNLRLVWAVRGGN